MSGTAEPKVPRPAEARMSGLLGCVADGRLRPTTPAGHRRRQIARSASVKLAGENYGSPTSVHTGLRTLQGHGPRCEIARPSCLRGGQIIRQNGQIARQNAPFTATVESRVIAWFSFDLIQTVRGPSKHHAVAVPRLGYDTPVNCGRSARTPICWTHLKEKARVYPGEYRDRLPAMWELFPLLTGPTASILTA